MIAMRPWCADCGRVLSPSHPMAKKALESVNRRREAGEADSDER